MKKGIKKLSAKELKAVYGGPGDDEQESSVKWTPVTLKRGIT
jgi:bacteriocin-like protein